MNMVQEFGYSSSNPTADPPEQVIDAFRDVQQLEQIEKDQRMKPTYANDVIPRARGEAEQVLQQAEAYKKKL